MEMTQREPPEAERPSGFCRMDGSAPVGAGPQQGEKAMFNRKARLLIVGSMIAAGTGGCVMVPVASDGTPLYGGTLTGYPAIPVATVQGPGPGFLAPVPPPPRNTRAPVAAPPPAFTSASVPLADPVGTAPPVTLQARLYPSNDVATQTGLLSGTVSNMMNGQGVFQLSFRGEVLTGEATRVPGDDRRGVAHAYGQRGTYMSCDYRMTTPYQGTGTCSLSNGAQSQVHIGG